MPAAALDVPETTVLFLAANPVEVQLLQLGEECRAIEDKIRAAKFRERLRFRSRWAARPDDLLQALHEDDPTVLHFSGHGVGAQGLCFLAEDGRALLVNSDGLGQVIRAAGDRIQLVVLNACYTKVQAEALIAHVACVIGMPSAIGDKAAIIYAAELYRALAFGKSVANAHQCGLAALALGSVAGSPRDITAAGSPHDIEVAEAALRTARPELLARTGVDAGHVHIVQAAPATSPVSASPGESRIHLEIDIEGDFETLDAITLGKLVSEIVQLSGGRPARILCVTKGSIRLHLSLEPDAARALLSLRESGRLSQISGLLISNVVDLGQVEISTQALEHADAPRPSLVPAVAVPREVSDVSGNATTLYAALEHAAPFLTQIAHRLCGDEWDARDLVQYTMARALRTALPADVRSMRAWLVATMCALFIERSRGAPIPPEKLDEDVLYLINTRILDLLREFLEQGDDIVQTRRERDRNG